MIWLTKQDLITLHSDVTGATGGLDGVRDDGLLQSALTSPLQTYGGVDLFPSVIDKAVRLACGLSQNHPFFDGNKRASAHTMLVVLQLNGIAISYTQQELASVFWDIAAGKIGFDQLKQWVCAHLAPIVE